MWKTFQEMGLPDHLTCLLRTCIQLKKKQLEVNMEELIGSKLREEYNKAIYCHQSSSVQLLSHIRFFVTQWNAARQASLSNTNSPNLLKLVSIESVMPASHLILCHLLLLMPSIFPNIKVFSKELALCIRWPKYWSFSATSVPLMNTQD